MGGRGENSVLSPDERMRRWRGRVSRGSTRGGRREKRKRWQRREMAAGVGPGEAGRRHATVGAAPAELSHARAGVSRAQLRVRRGVGYGIYGTPCDECGAFHFYRGREEKESA